MSAVKIGEDKSALLLVKENFFAVRNPRKDLHHLHWTGFIRFSERKTASKMAIFADRHAESEQE